VTKFISNVSPELESISWTDESQSFFTHPWKHRYGWCSARCSICFIL